MKIRIATAWLAAMLLSVLEMLSGNAVTCDEIGYVALDG